MSDTTADAKASIQVNKLGPEFYFVKFIQIALVTLLSASMKMMR